MEDQEAKEEFVETLISDIMDQLDVLDPNEDSDDILKVLAPVLKTEEGAELLAYLLGTKTIDEWFEPLVDLIDDEDE